MSVIKNILIEANDFQQRLRGLFGIKTKKEKNLDILLFTMMDKINLGDEYWREFGCDARFRILQGLRR